MLSMLDMSAPLPKISAAKREELLAELKKRADEHRKTFRRVPNNLRCHYCGR